MLDDDFRERAQRRRAIATMRQGTLGDESFEELDPAEEALSAVARIFRVELLSGRVGLEEAEGESRPRLRRSVASLRRLRG